MNPSSIYCNSDQTEEKDSTGITKGGKIIKMLLGLTFWHPSFTFKF
jgi:hypothetical protein